MGAAQSAVAAERRRGASGDGGDLLLGAPGKQPRLRFSRVQREQQQRDGDAPLPPPGAARAAGAPYEPTLSGPPRPPCDAARAAYVESLGLHGAPPSAEIEGVLRLACGIFNARAALVVLVGDGRIWIKDGLNFQVGVSGVLLVCLERRSQGLGSRARAPGALGARPGGLAARRRVCAQPRPSGLPLRQQPLGPAALKPPTLITHHQTGDFPWRKSFCAWTLASEQAQPLIVPDATADPRRAAAAASPRRSPAAPGPSGPRRAASPRQPPAHPFPPRSPSPARRPAAARRGPPGSPRAKPCTPTPHLRFAGNDLVKAGHVGFYAGTPLISRGGHRLGTLCCADPSPRACPDERQARDAAAAAAAAGRRAAAVHSTPPSALRARVPCPTPAPTLTSLRIRSAFRIRILLRSAPSSPISQTSSPPTSRGPPSSPPGPAPLRKRPRPRPRPRRSRRRRRRRGQGPTAARPCCA
jgi:GAF domain-containing protein